MMLDSRVALITGGIGKAAAQRLAQDGAKIAIGYVGSSDPAEALAAELKADGHEAHAFQADVSKPEENRRLVEEVVKHFGTIDILVCCAGIEHFGTLQDIKPEDFERVFAVNVAGQLFVSQAAAPNLPKGGRIVLTSSVSAGIAVFHHTLYMASKAAVSAMALNLAPELGEREITINAIAPGGTATDMAEQTAKRYTPPILQDVPQEKLAKSRNALQRLGHPEEVAAAISFLVSPDASYVTGTTLKVDGGQL